MSGQLDVQRVLYNMHQRNVPLKVLHEKAEEYMKEKLMDRGQAINMIRAIEAERLKSSCYAAIQLTALLHLLLYCSLVCLG